MYFANKAEGISLSQVSLEVGEKNIGGEVSQSRVTPVSHQNTEEGASLLYLLVCIVCIF